MRVCESFCHFIVPGLKQPSISVSVCKDFKQFEQSPSLGVERLVLYFSTATTKPILPYSRQLVVEKLRGFRIVRRSTRTSTISLAEAWRKSCNTSKEYNVVDLYSY